MNDLKKEILTMFRRYLFIALAIGVAAGFIGLGSALFTDNQSVSANTFSNGTVDISTSPTTALVTFSNMAPGDLVVAPITVNNAGTLNLRYAISATATNTDTKGLMSQLQLSIKQDVTTCTAPAAVNTNFDATGTYIYNALPLGNTTGLNIVGDPTTGFQTGDRPLAAGASEILCFKVALPQGTGNAYQGATTTATFAFVAEQTTNNP
jgi:spore coat-associated protein N